MTIRRIAVIGDVHGNLRAFEAAGALARRQGCTEFVLLGDLLTYGLDTVAVVEAVADMCANFRVTLIRGNHDAIYLGKAGETLGYEEKLPAWLRESIAHTRASLPERLFASLPFVDEYEMDDLYFGHANPFGRANWRYLNSDDDHREAIAILGQRKRLAGFFGHTHRPKVAKGEGQRIVYLPLPLSGLALDPEQGPYCINAGSIGQPRDSQGRIYIVVLELADAVRVSFLEVHYDIAAFVRELSSSELTDETKRQLLKYFR
jgi:predicted phosphodiesterase